MKSVIELQQHRRCIVLFLIGFFCTMLAYLIYIIDPVKIIVQEKLKMTPTSYIFELWKKPPIEVFVNIYIFNITNAEAFMSGQEDLKVQEIGPYVYQEVLENQNVTWNENGTLSYIPKRTVIFRPEMSKGVATLDYVTVPNVPLLGISSTMHDMGFLVNYPFVQLANYLGSKPILNITVHEYLWGYDDDLISLAGTVVPSYIDFDKFGLLDRMYDEGENLINMNIKGNDDMTKEEGRYLSIESINGSPGLSNWGYVKEGKNEIRPENSKCNKIRGATEGAVFPTHMDPNAVFRIYRKAFCRPLPIVFQKKVNNAGLPGNQYTLAENFADPPELNPENKCYCYKGQCMKKGLMELTPCYYRIPTAGSLPHFLNSDPSIHAGVVGLEPDPEKHKTVIILQPNIGIPMYVHSRLQTNLVMKETRYNSKIKPFNSLVVPLFWSDLEIPKLPSNLLLLLHLAVNIGPALQVAIVIMLSVGGLATICYSLVRTLSIAQQEAALIDDDDRRNSTDLRIPRGCGQYTAIRILPAVKKITSKTDLFM